MSVPAFDKINTAVPSPDSSVAPGVAQSAKKWIVAAALVLVAFSVFTRLAQLDTKPFWFDEEIVAVLISSTPESSFRQCRAKVMTASDWRKLEVVLPTAPLSEVLFNLKVKGLPDQAPLYCLAARLWIQAFGNSVYSIRLISVVFSVLAFPIVFLLAREMFDSVECAWLSVALLACSPFQLLYAQEARQYTMWVCVAALAWIALARAQKKPSVKRWLAFGIASAISILTHYASFLLVACSGAASLITNRKSFGGLVIAGVSCVLFMAPWFLYAGLACLGSYNEGWMLSPRTPEQYLFESAINGTRIFLDFPWPTELYMQAMVYAIFCLELAAIAFAYKRASRAGRCILLSAALYVLVILLLDLTTGGSRMLIVRYLTPIYVLTQMCVASCLFNLLKTRSWLAISIFLLTACGGAASCVNIVNSPECWNKYPITDDLSLADKLNRKEHCLLVCRERIDTLIMSRLVHENVLLETATAKKVTIPADVNSVFVVTTDRDLVEAISKTGHWQTRQLNDKCWQMVRVDY